MHRDIDTVKTPEVESEYANLQQLDISEPNTPDIEHSEFQKTLQDTWDVYRDPTTNRLFYVNKNSHETQWKPPRGQFHDELHKKRSRSSGEYEEVTLPALITSRGNRKSRSVDYGKPRIVLETNVPEGWTFNVKDTGEDVFVNNETQQEWYRAHDTYGRSYYYRQSRDMVHTVWHLPRSGNSSPAKSPQSDGDNKNDFTTPGQGLVQGPRSGDRFQVSDRFAKSRSVMIENLHFNAPPINTGPPPPKSATLPPNFTAPIHEDLEPIEGWLNKCKFVNGKKPSKKWAMTYVKLGGSNLVFYKDQKSSQPKQGAPHGKYDQLVSLATCSVDKDTEKYTSKKYTIGITCSDCQILLQADDESKMQEWFMKIHTRIQELGGSPDIPSSGQTSTNALTPEPDKVSRKPSFKDRSHSRKQSDSGTLERKGKIKNVLERFMSNRSEKEKLIKKGIYKDAVFGSEIKQLCAKEKTKVPMFVVKSIDAIEKRGLEHEGIYRIGGNISQIQKLRCMVDQGEQYDLDDPMWDVNVLAGTLKLFFRELKDPLFTYALFDKFLKHFLNEKASERLKGIKATIDELPKQNYETIKVLFKHLSKVKDLCKENKMGSHQLAIVFGPTLIWPEVQHQNLATSMVYQSRIVEYTLLEYEKIFR
ncbi:rho GTPase-activating protein 15-like isoform X2 [Mercenaria mercenaria]|uniref:rho GTPase-activating protein 15-like isoform X2 n=1 Tax=Mercenaria mercenaria TaxID=6596 RepID=UPI00234EEF32|nr:rho GTPase-activating protein 15-like isoform X2 [Mercenaria mercenaria]